MRPTPRALIEEEDAPDSERPADCQVPLAHRVKGSSGLGESRYTDTGWLRVVNFECYWAGRQSQTKSTHVNDQHYAVGEFAAFV